MKALGLQPRNITDAEKRIFDVWLDDYGNTLNEILAFAEKGVGVDNKFKYVKKIIEEEYFKRNPDRKLEMKEKSKDSKLSRDEFYEACRRKSERELNARCEKIYSQIPQIQKIDSEIKKLNMESISTGLSGAYNSDAVSKQIDEQINKKIQQKKSLLEANGFTLSDMELNYNCQLCKDTGIKENDTSCACYLQGFIS